MNDALKHFNDPDIKVSAIFATLGSFLASLNALLTCVCLTLNIGFIVWKWNKNRNKKQNEEEL